MTFDYLIINSYYLSCRFKIIFCDGPGMGQSDAALLFKEDIYSFVKSTD